MPEISLFFGIRITIYYKDHNPPHIHAEYAGHKALIDIQDICVLRGFLPGRQFCIRTNSCRIGNSSRVGVNPILFHRCERGDTHESYVYA